MINLIQNKRWHVTVFGGWSAWRVWDYTWGREFASLSAGPLFVMWWRG